MYSPVNFKNRIVDNVKLGIIIAVMASITYGLSGCKQNTEDKIKEVLLSKEEQNLKADNETIESIKIDSIYYKSVSPQILLRDEFSVYDIYKLRKARLTGELMAYNNHPLKEFASQMKEYEKELKGIEQHEKMADSLIANADTTRSIYAVSYLLRAKTNKNSYEKSKTLLLKADNLEEYHTENIRQQIK